MLILVNIPTTGDYLKKAFPIVSFFAFLFIFICPAAGQDENERIQENSYDLGDQIFVINAGPIIPLFFDFYLGSGIIPALPDYYRFPVGLDGSIEWGSFITPSMLLGFEIEGMFLLSQINTHAIIPVSGKFTYDIKAGIFDIPLSVNAGVCVNKLSNYIYFGPFLKAGIGLFWHFSPEWNFGLQADYWWVPEFYWGEEPPSSQSSFGNFLTVNLSALYHF